mgnify:FL=1
MLNYVQVPKALLTVTEAACALNCSTEPIYRLIRKGELPIIMRGKRYLIPADALQKYISTHCVKY